MLMRVLVHAGLDHFVIEVVAFARALAHAREHRIAAVRLGDVIDQFLDEHGLSHAGAAEQTDLAAPGVGSEQVNDLDAGDKHFDLGRLLDEGRRESVNRSTLIRLNRAGLVDRLSNDVYNTTKRLVAHWNGDGFAGVGHFLAAHQPVSRVHCDGAHSTFAEMLRYLQDEAVAVILRLKCIQDRGQWPIELNVHNSARNLPYPANSSIAHLFLPQNRPCPSNSGAVTDSPVMTGEIPL